MTAPGKSLEETQALIQETFDYLLQEATNTLSLGGSFAPFGAGIRGDGERTHVNIDLPWDRSTPNQHIQALIQAFRTEAQDGKLVVAGLVFDGRMRRETGDGQSALVMHIEHGGGEGVQVFMPYKRLEDAANPYFDDPIVEPIEPEIFKNAA